MRNFEKMLLPLGWVLILLFVVLSGAFFVLSERPSEAPVVPLDEDTGMPVSEELANITVAEPVAGDVVGLPLIITGQARVFENVFQYRIVDDAGVVLARGYALADAPDVGLFGPFTLSLHYAEPTTDMGVVEVFSYSARDGAEENMVRIPVVFSPDVVAQYVDVYFLPRNMGTDCDEVVRVERRVSSTLAVAHAAITELLNGPQLTEGGELISLLPSYAHVRSLVIEEGVATVTFTKDSFLGVAGSCTVLGIRAQIEATLRQFSSVHSVVIVEEGKTIEETLQP